MQRTTTSRHLGSIDLDARFHLLHEGVSGVFGFDHVFEGEELAGNDRQEGFGTFAQEVASVCDDQQSSRELVGGGDESINGIDVKKVSRLVHDQEVGAHVSELGKDDARPLRIREVLHTSGLNAVLDRGFGQVLTQGSTFRVGKLFHHELHGSHVHFQLCGRVLTKIGENKVGVSVHIASRSLDLFSEQLEECRFAGTVRAHDTNTGLCGNFEVDRIVEDKREALVSIVAETDILQLQQCGGTRFLVFAFAFNCRKCCGLGESEFACHLDLALGKLVLPLFQVGYAFAGHGGRVRFGVQFEKAFSVDVLFLVFLQLAFFKFTEPTRVVLDLVIFQKEDRGCDIAEEVSVVCNEEKGLGVATQFVLQPQHGRKVEMVGGLVQK
mmetsp:Transcript_11383/g.21676  ORF Transcript_11383/g.21676 Transcript_11383/m.21676 type:complete len:382 (+) Transcript_11383:838-1983(+)